MPGALVDTHEGKDASVMVLVANVGRTAETAIRVNDEVFARFVSALLGTGGTARDDLFAPLFEFLKAVKFQIHSVIWVGAFACPAWGVS